MRLVSALFFSAAGIFVLRVNSVCMLFFRGHGFETRGLLNSVQYAGTFRRPPGTGSISDQRRKRFAMAAMIEMVPVPVLGRAQTPFFAAMPSCHLNGAAMAKNGVSSRLERLAESSRPGDVCGRLLSAPSLIIGLIERKERRELQNSMRSLRSLRPFIPVASPPRVHGEHPATIGPAAKTGRTQIAGRTQESRLGKGTDTLLRCHAFMPSERLRYGEKWSQCPGCMNSISRLSQRGQQGRWRRHRQTSC